MSPIDFSKLAREATEASSQLVHPRGIFNALPNKDSRYGYLRAPQDQVLDQWFERRTNRDTVIKLNTGGGKTAVGLLIALSCMNEGVGPVCYLTPDHYLASQVREQASQLGIATVDDPEQFAFQNGEAILVDVFHKLFNGQSVFGVSTSAGRPARFQVKTVIVDDAHACLTAAGAQFRLEVLESEPAFEELIDLFGDALEQQSSAGLLDLKSRKPTAVQQVPYWAWSERQDQVLEILHPLSADHSRLFTWPLLVDVLPLCRAVLTANGFEVAAPCLPVMGVTGFAEASRRVFLTATLADDGVLVAEFDADPDQVETPIVPANAGDIGDRMILVPQQTHPNANVDDIRQILVDLASERNVVVIVPSAARAEYWRPYAQFVLNKENLRQGVEKMRSDSTTGLVVLINRYDGVDLPGDACHVLVVDGLPEAISGIERVEQAQLAGSSLRLIAQVQRLEQGMGRATRSNEDHCVVILLGAQLAERLYHRVARQSFSPATRAQLELSLKLASELEGTELADLREVIDQCLNRDQDWVAASRGQLATLKYDDARVTPIAVQSRKAFDAAAVGEFRSAETELRSLLNGGLDHPTEAYIRQQIASYINNVDPAAAQQLQLAAFKSNRRLLRPVSGVTYEKLQSPTRRQGVAAASWLQEKYASGTELALGINALIADLEFGPRTDVFEQAWCDLASHIGFAGQRPEQDTGRGPDGLWALSEATFLVIEAKSGVAKDRRDVYKSEAQQLSNSMDWFKAQYPGVTGKAVLVHRSAKFERKAAFPQGCRVITAKKLDKLQDALKRLATSLSDEAAFRDPTRVGPLLHSHGFSPQKLLSSFAERAVAKS